MYSGNMVFLCELTEEPNIHFPHYHFSPTWLRFEDKLIKHGEGRLQMDQTLLPFDISFESLETKEHFLAGFIG